MLYKSVPGRICGSSFPSDQAQESHWQYWTQADSIFFIKGTKFICLGLLLFFSGGSSWKNLSRGKEQSGWGHPETLGISLVFSHSTESETSEEGYSLPR